MKGLEPSTFCMASRSAALIGSRTPSLEWLEWRSRRSFHDSLVRWLVRSRGAGPLVVRSSGSRRVYGRLRDDRARPALDGLPAGRDDSTRRRAGVGGQVAQRGRHAGPPPARRRAWLARDGAPAGEPRSGRPAPGHLTEFQARRRIVELVEAVEAERAAARARAAEAAARETAAGGPTFRALAHAWLEHLEFVLGAKPATLRDYRSMLAEPGTPYRRGRGVRIGRIMAALGDVPAAGGHDRADRGAAGRARARGRRSAQRQQAPPGPGRDLQLRPAPGARGALAPDGEPGGRRGQAPRATRRLASRSSPSSRSRRSPARPSRAPGAGRTTTSPTRALCVDAEEDAQLGELLRVAAYTGLRRGELVALRWRDVRWSERVLVVERALSGDVEGTTKGGRVRYVPLGDQALARPRPPLAPPELHARRRLRLRQRRPATASTRSALRRRYVAARDAAGLPPLRFHDLRHTAGTLLTRVLDPVTVRDVLGHADLKTTERYLHAVRASRLRDAATRAFTPDTDAARGAAARTSLPQRRWSSSAPKRRAGSSKASDSRDDRLPVDEGPRAARRAHARAALLRDRPPARLPPKAQGSRPAADHLRIPRPRRGRTGTGPQDPLPRRRPWRRRSAPLL